jgi:hypothetical protein
MMQLIRELMNSMKVGWYAGRGNKCLKAKKYEKALNYYFCALNCKKNNFGNDAYLRQKSLTHMSSLVVMKRLIKMPK